MHYYKRNIGDYHKKAGRLSMLQHGAYTLLIDSCYDREKFPTLQDAIEWTWASTKEECEAVHFVLQKFFTLKDGVYVQNRIQEEIVEYHEKSAINTRIAIERETKRRENSTKREPDVNEPPPNHKPITNNQDNTKPTSKKSAISIKTFRENCASNGEKCIPTDDAVFDFAEKTKIPIEMVKVCWNVFVQRNTESGKRQADWRKAFRNCVQGNWYKLWYVEADGSVKETSQYRALKKGVEDV